GLIGKSVSLLCFGIFILAPEAFYLFYFEEMGKSIRDSQKRKIPYTSYNTIGFSPFLSHVPYAKFTTMKKGIMLSLFFFFFYTCLFIFLFLFFLLFSLFSMVFKSTM